MIRSLHTGARVLLVSALAVATVPFGAPVLADPVRTDTTLAGFAVTVEASPLRVLIDDPELQIPHDPGTAILEGDPNYTLASVSAGPNARAVTSTLWPGNLIGEGLSQLASGQNYPIKGEARYPDKPYDASSVDQGQLSGAHAEGLDASATADGTPTNKPGQVMLGGVTSTSTATVTAKNVAVGTASSAVADVNLLAGLIKIGAVKTVVSTSADGKKATSSGTTTAAGLTIAGQQFGVDDKGLHAGATGSALPGLSLPSQVSSLLGISARTLDQVTTKTSGGMKRVAGGLIIDIDTGPLRKQLAPVTGVVNPILNSLISNLPAQAASQLYYLVKATPHLTFIFASANTASAATLPLTLPPITFPSFPSNPGTTTGGILPGGTGGGTGGIAPGPVIDPGGSSGGIAPTSGGGSGGVTPPQVLPPGTVAAGSSTDAGFSGIGIGWLLGAFLGAGLIGWGLLRFLGLAGGSLLGVGCRLGAPTSVPDLRSVTS